MKCTCMKIITKRGNTLVAFDDGTSFEEMNSFIRDMFEKPDGELSFFAFEDRRMKDVALKDVKILELSQVSITQEIEDYLDYVDAEIEKLKRSQSE